MSPAPLYLLLLCAMSGPAALADLPAAAADEVPAITESDVAAPPAGEPAAGTWRFSLTPYLWLTAQKGDVTVKGQTAPVDLDLSDSINLLKDNFNGGLALHAEAGTGPLSIFGDGMYISLETSQEDPTGTSRASYTQGLFELGAAYAVVGSPDGSAGPTVEPLIGARIYYLDGTISGAAGNVQASNEQTWIDGFIGARLTLPVTGPLSFFARGDVGAGGSDLAWNVLAGADLTFGRVFSIQAGYRWLDVDYTEGGGSDQFAYDMLLQGPFIGLTFRF